MRSTTPPPPSSGADTEPRVPPGPGGAENGAAPDPQAVLAAAELLSARDVFGMAWLDEALIVRATFGRLVGFVPVNVPIGEALLPFAGMEDEIRALRSAPGAMLDLPSVGIVSSGGTLPRLNLLVLWSATQMRYLLVATRATSAAGIEAELARQMRARLMAEAEVRAKSQELARANTELAQANRDLEDFASIISHDLSAPLRAMRDLTRRVEAQIRDAGDNAATEALATTGRLEEQAARLSSMLRDLLEFSSIGRKQDAVESVDTGALVNRIVRSIPRPAGFCVTVGGDWPVIETLAAPLDIVVRNLVDNAIKHHDRGDGMVAITAEVTGEALAITIADDGPGIRPEQREAAFLPFRTLATRDAGGRAGGGTGMGLAFVRRTVETIGGRLDLESVPELSRGVSFRVTWPLRLPD